MAKDKSLPFTISSSSGWKKKCRFVMLASVSSTVPGLAQGVGSGPTVPANAKKTTGGKDTKQNASNCKKSIASKDTMSIPQKEEYTTFSVP